MSKKGKGKSNLGKSLIKDKYGRKKRNNSSFLHTSEINDGQDWSRLNAQSITEQSHVEDLLDLAELAGAQFKAEKMNIKFINTASMIGILSADERRKILKVQDDNKSMLRIPRRPPWDRSMSGEELALAERESFLLWRRSLSQLQETEGITMTPFEKNLDFWRQLWRVVERSDVVVQIVDARNPLLFYCTDLSYYVKEMSAHKENVILVNKADFLTEEQRKYWFEYFDNLNLKAVFFSALQETLETINENDSETVIDALNSDDDSITELDSDDSTSELTTDEPNLDASVDSAEIARCLTDLEQLELLAPDKNVCEIDNQQEPSLCKYEILNNFQLLEFFQTFKIHPLANHCHVTIGLVGYPNVGKSSTINCLLQEKKVSVSATPGKTKHFQTLFLSKEILLCDCPGLVFPAFVSSKEEMILSGVLSIDQMRDHVPPVNLMLSLMPRHVLEDNYGIAIPLPQEGEDPERHPISEEFLNAYGYMRGFMTPRGIPDHPRSARYVLKDFMNGKILYSHAPPGVSQVEYHPFSVPKIRKHPVQLTPHQKSATMQKYTKSDKVDEDFFCANSKMHYKGKPNMRNPSLNLHKVDSDVTSKPWRVKPDRGKREKSRIKFAHLDY